MKRIIFLTIILTLFTTSIFAQKTNPLFKVLVNGKVGFIDRTGKMVIKPQFDFVRDFSEGLAEVNLNMEDIKTGYQYDAPLIPPYLLVLQGV